MIRLSDSAWLGCLIVRG